MKKYSGNITPEPNTIFVFGSNDPGHHDCGAALIAMQQFGAKYGQGSGLQGNSYGLVTTDLYSYGLYPLSKIKENIAELYEVAKQNPDLNFKIAYRNMPYESTLCGYKGADLQNQFKLAGEIPDNIWFSEEWYDYMI